MNGIGSDAGKPCPNALRFRRDLSEAINRVRETRQHPA
jgi:hypothetical protein